MDISKGSKFDGMEQLQQDSREDLAKLLGVDMNALEGMMHQAGRYEQVMEAYQVDEKQQEATTLTVEEMDFFNVSFSDSSSAQVDDPLEQRLPKIRKTYLIPENLVARFDQFCTEQDVKKTDAITVAMEEFLARYI